MRLLAILFVAGTVAAAAAALRERSSAETAWHAEAEKEAAVEAARDREVAEASHAAQVVAHTTGPLPFGLVRSAPPEKIVTVTLDEPPRPLRTIEIPPPVESDGEGQSLDTPMNGDWTY